MNRKLIQSALLAWVFGVAASLSFAFTPGTQLTLNIYPKEYSQGKTDVTCNVNASVSAGNNGGLQNPPGDGNIQVVRVDASGSSLGNCWSFTYPNGTTSTEVGNYIPNMPGTYYYRGKFTRNDGNGGYEEKWTDNTVTIHVLMVEITDNQGNIITTKHTTCTGREVDLHTELTPNVTGIEARWTVPGNIVKNYVSGVLTPMTDADMQHNTIDFYWADGDTNTRTVQYNCNYDTAQLWDSVQFDVQAPTLVNGYIPNNSGPISITDFGGGNGTELAYGTPNSWGMVCSSAVKAPDMFGGDIKYVQIGNVNRMAKHKDANNNTITLQATTNGEYWLDGNDPYNGGSSGGGPFPITAGDTITKSTMDAPGQAIEDDFWASTNNDYKMYMMFKPTGGIWVPVGVLTWGYRTIAEKHGANWVMGSAPNNADITTAEEDTRLSTPTNTFPVWRQDKTLPAQWQQINP